jgi:hypothetical protein
MMTRKDYISIANVLNGFLKDANQHPALVANYDDFLVRPFIKLLENDNPNFNADKFWEACFND